MLPERIATQVIAEGKPKVGICAGNIELIDGTASHTREEAAPRLAVSQPDFDDLFLDRFLRRQ